MNRENPEGLPEDWKAIMDQGIAGSIDLAVQTAAYYKSLVEQGVPAGDAATITQAYVRGIFWMTRGGGDD